jgi:hypothetical protein
VKIERAGKGKTTGGQDRSKCDLQRVVWHEATAICVCLLTSRKEGTRLKGQILVASQKMSGEDLCF